jgi:hypothetical protein
MRFAPFPTINSVFSNAVELRLLSRKVFEFHMENRNTMTSRDVASELSNSNEEREPRQGGTARTPPAGGPESRR